MSMLFAQQCKRAVTVNTQHTPQRYTAMWPMLMTQNEFARHDASQQSAKQATAITRISKQSRKLYASLESHQHIPNGAHAMQSTRRQQRNTRTTSTMKRRQPRTQSRLALAST
jgi:hypothetical protein